MDSCPFFPGRGTGPPSSRKECCGQQCCTPAKLQNWITSLPLDSENLMYRGEGNKSLVVALKSVSYPEIGDSSHLTLAPESQDSLVLRVVKTKKTEVSSGFYVPKINSVISLN